MGPASHFTPSTPLGAEPGGGGGGGGAVTVRICEPVLPSPVAMIEAVPAVTALTAPLCDTVATLVFELDQINDTPPIGLPLASRATAVAEVDPPLSTDVLPSCTVTVATVGGSGVSDDTVIGSTPVFPSLVAEIVTDPPPTAVTTPVTETVATVGFELDQPIERLVSVLPDASLTTAVSCAVCPTLSVVVVAVSVTVDTAATGGGLIESDCMPATPSMVAMMVTDPAFRVFTTPVADTVASSSSVLDHDTAPAITSPAAFRATAAACVLWPVRSEECCRVTVTVDTWLLGADTVTGTEAKTPSEVAVMDAVPAACAVTRPSDETVAMSMRSEAHATGRFITAPSEPRTSAAN